MAPMGDGYSADSEFRTPLQGVQLSSPLLADEEAMKTTTLFTSVFCVALIATSTLVAQELPPQPKPQKEHEWLYKFVGEWESEAEGPAGPGQPPTKCKGTISARKLGGYWVVSDLKTELSGVQIVAVQTVGYDPQSKKFVGTWVDSMLNYLWKYQGSLDESGKILTLEAEGPNFMVEGKTAKFRDVYEFKTPDHFVQSSQMQGDDGKWVTFMTGNSRRKK